MDSPSLLAEIELSCISYAMERATLSVSEHVYIHFASVSGDCR